MAQNDKATWHDIDTAAFTGDAKKAWAAYKAAQEAANTARDKFEATIRNRIASIPDLIPAGRVPVFSYRFGKLAVTAGDAQRERGPAKGALKI